MIRDLEIPKNKFSDGNKFLKNNQKVKSLFNLFLKMTYNATTAKTTVFMLANIFEKKYKLDGTISF